MSRRSAAVRSGQRKSSSRPAKPVRWTWWAAALAVLVVVLGAAASIVDIWESPTWLKVALTVLGAAVAVIGVVLNSQWWRERQEAQAAEHAGVAQRARVQEQDWGGHFDPRGRGVLPFRGRRGWYFTGRTRALQELSGWLAGAPDRPPAMRVVTGAPGSGKSAVLGRLVTLADPTFREAALAVDRHLNPATLPPKGAIDLAVHVRRQTTAKLVEMIAADIGVDAGSDEELLAALETQTRPLTVVVDALDEAKDAEEMAGLLTRVAATGKVRLLVGTRRNLVEHLVDPGDALDLDDPAYLDPDDLAEYVRRCLLLEGDPDAHTPYRGQSEVADMVAAAVAERAGRSFLVAQLVGLALVKDEQVVDVTQPGWRERFPREVGEAMREYLRRFGDDRAKVRDLLVPLAFAEGDGLTDKALWAALASELGTRTYQAQDVRWLLQDTSAPNLLQPAELDDGTLAWRLFHEALAEHLRHELPLPCSGGSKSHHSSAR
jgi:hypothetical protein